MDRTLYFVVAPRLFLFRLVLSRRAVVLLASNWLTGKTLGFASRFLEVAKQFATCVSEVAKQFATSHFVLPLGYLRWQTQ